MCFGAFLRANAQAHNQTNVTAIVLSKRHDIMPASCKWGEKKSQVDPCRYGFMPVSYHAGILPTSCKRGLNLRCNVQLFPNCKMKSLVPASTYYLKLSEIEFILLMIDCLSLRHFSCSELIFESFCRHDNILFYCSAGLAKIGSFGKDEFLQKVKGIGSLTFYSQKSVFSKRKTIFLQKDQRVCPFRKRPTFVKRQRVWPISFLFGQYRYF